MRVPMQAAWEYLPPWERATDACEKELPLPVYDPEVDGREMGARNTARMSAGQELVVMPLNRKPTLSSFPILIKTTLPSAKDVTIFVLLLPPALFMEEDDLREVREKIAIICRFATLSPVASRRQGDLLLSASSVRLSRTEVLWSQASIGNSELGLNLQIMKLKSETLG
ncbi:hypothetical protein CRG98_012308 [Punica granatum]|uniref:Uncharacterized protein n=1 Tax=Punica granatum TaxID=22663 RepID=A0A2I0KFK5_PUNGR|nr:hypothetical protein CRG98_012308 [Punica granatum]